MTQAQQNGRFAALKNQGFDLFQRGRYTEAGGKFEEVWENDQTDTRVAQYLAMSYLYGEGDVEKARPVMQKTLELGAPAIFMVLHSHERSTMLSGSTMNQYCTGRILISPAKLEFAADSSDHSFIATAADLKEFKVNESLGRFQIKPGGKTYTFRVKSGKTSEALLLGKLAEQNFKQ